jgi:radical SAM protein with 4Fe4S-binding SPASM domain
MRQLGVRSVMFAGEGEPLLHPQLAQVINACGDVNLDVGITTNGTAMTRKFIDKCGHNVKWIKVSVNGGSTSYDRIHYCNENHYELVWKNLEYAISKNPRPTVGIQCVALPDNSQDLIELTTRAREYKLDYIVIKPYSQHKMSNTKRYRPIKYSESSEGEAMSDIFDLCEELATDEFEVIVRRESMNTWDKRERPYTTCHSTPYFWAYIMATGDVYGCSAYLLDPRFNYGNIKDNTFEEIWQGEKRQESMDYVKNELCIDECRRNCRMDKVNRYLWELKNPNEHDSFI